MSMENINKFHAHLKSHPEAYAALTTSKSVDELCQRAVSMVAPLGLAFTEAEARRWIEASQLSAKPDGELTDDQLETAAGGKAGRLPDMPPPFFDPALDGGINPIRNRPD